MRRLFLAAALLLGGCIDFREITAPAPPPPPPPLPAEFHASLLLEDGVPPEPGQPPAAMGVRIHAFLKPGRDARGEPRAIRDDTLRIAGTALTPARVESDGTRSYEGWIPLPPGSPRGILLAVSPPGVDSGEAPTPVLELPIPVRTGGDTLEMETGADLQLPVATAWPAHSGEWFVDQGWDLRLGGGSSPLVISGSGRMPTPLVVPASLAPAGPFDVHLSVHSRIGVGGIGEDGYSVEILFHAFLRWMVLRGEGSPAG